MTAERDMLVQSATSIFRDLCSPEMVRRGEGTGWAETLWSELAQAGFPWISVPEERGGAGGHVSDACALLLAAGAHAAPVPLAETGLLAGWALSSAKLAVPTGPATVAVNARNDTVELSKGGRGTWRLSGKLHRVPWAHASERLVLIAGEGVDRYVLSVPTSKASVRAGRNLAGEPRDTVLFANMLLDDDSVAPAPRDVTVGNMSLRGALARAALMAGALQRVAALTNRYASQREQFGRPISRFQAVQHHLVRIAENAEASAISVAVAAGTAHPNPAFLETACAKIVSGEAATAASAAAHQAHGAIGMTREYELAQLTRRLWSWRDEFGGERHWCRQLGNHLVQAQEHADSLWPKIAGGAAPALAVVGHDTSSDLEGTRK